MPTLPFDSIIIPPERQRRYFDLGKLIELADDIAQNGLLHALVVQDKTNILVAGERRLRAIEILKDTGREFMYAGFPIPLGHVPVTLAHTRDDLGWMEAELSENICRQDLTWQERAAAISRLDAIRKRQSPSHTPKDTLAELQAQGPIGAETVYDALRVADHLTDPDIASAKTQRDAMKVLERKARVQKARELAERFDLEVGSSCPHTALQGDALSLMSKLPDQTFDLLLTDPPYGINAQDHGSQNILAHHYDDSPERWLGLMTLLASESFRACKPQAHAYVFCDINQWDLLSKVFRIAGWDVWPRPMIWSKSVGILPKPKFGPRYTYEGILFANKGDRPIILEGQPDVLSHVIPTQNRIHGAEKPVALYNDLLRRSVRPGDSVLDPFSGSGTIFPAANLARCRATGIELNPDYYAIGVSRIEGTI
jgi:site-specific DNA-methyltransferase (adenine-specific)